MKNSGKLRPKFGTHVTGDGFWAGALPDPETLISHLENGESVKLIFNSAVLQPIEVTP